MPPFAEIVNSIRDAMPLIPTRIVGRGLRSRWEAPPLLTDAVLNGYRLDSLYEGMTRMTVEEIWQVYEEVVNDYVVTGKGIEKPTDFFTTRLGMSKSHVEWLFPQQLAWNPELFLLPLLTLMKAAGADVVDCPSPGYLVNIADIKIGITEHRRLLSRFNGAMDACIDARTEMEHWPRGNGARMSQDNALSSFYRESIRIEDETTREAVQLALRFLYFRYGHLGRLTTYLYEGIEIKPKRDPSRTKAMRAEALKLRDRVSTAHDPGKLLINTFVDAGYMDLEQLEERFPGSTTGGWVSAETLLLWTKKLTRMGNRK